MTDYKMKFRIPVIFLAAACCLSCVKTNLELGGSLVPTGQTYKLYTVEIPIEDISMRMADSLSGYSSTRVTIGAIKDSDYGLTTRASAFALIPMHDTLDFGKNPVFKSFHFSLGRDSLSFVSPYQEHIIQNVNVYELADALKDSTNFDCNSTIPHKSARITKGSPIYNGGDSLSFNFSSEFGKKYMTITQSDLENYSQYIKKFPGIYLETSNPLGNGGRINMFNLQLSYNSSYGYITGNYAKLSFSGEYDGARKDSSFYFYYGATKFYDIDSLLSKSGTGSFPEYALNLTSQSTRSKAGKAGDEILVEGGGGLKPCISAKSLKKLVEAAIVAKGGDPKTAVINKASLIFPFEFPKDYTEMNIWPYRLSPTCRLKYSTSTSFMGLTDSSSSTENQGDVNRSTLEYAPDITYHIQELLKIDDSDKSSSGAKYLDNGSYDVWLLIMANEVTTTTNSSSSEMSEYYQYLAYQNYYNSMYGGGYGGGSGYGSYYSNYYNYQMLAAYANSSSSTTTTSVKLDKDRFYKAKLNGPANSGRKPTLKLVFAIPND